MSGRRPGEGEEAASPAEGELSIRLFGPLDVRVAGQPLPPFRTRKEGWLFALLALRAGRRVDRDWLATTLWPESPPFQARYNLRRCLSDLRRALGLHAPRLTSPTTCTLCLHLDGATADALAFDRAIARGDPASLAEAVALYRGPLLEDCAEEWVFQERAPRHQAHLSALRQLAERALAGGDPAAAGYLRRAIVAEPLDERLHRELMRALAANGNWAAVTQVYADLRQLLYRDLSAPPDPETTALYERIRADAREKASGGSMGGTGPSGPSGTSHTAHTAQTPHPPSPAPPPSPSPAIQLPQPLTRLVGREREVQAVRERLAAARLVTLTGTGGIGKTRLAMQVAAEIAGQLPDGACFVELAALADPSLVAQAAAAALAVQEEPGRALLRTLRDALASRTLLLVLDNCEHLLSNAVSSPARGDTAWNCAELVESLLRGCRHLRVLATSREPLGLPGEVVWRVPSLSLPPPESVETIDKETVAELMSYEAVRLFVERAAESRPDFSLSPANLQAAARICQQLDGIPLAIELAAARLKGLAAQQILDRLDDRFGLLTGGSRTALPRHRTLRATLDWSYDALSGPEQALLCRLSVFAGGWTLEAAEQICGSDEVMEWWSAGEADRSHPPLHYSTTPAPHSVDVLDLLTSLVDRSLVLCEEAGAARYRLLETVRQYARERLLEAGEEPTWRGRHRDYYLGLAEAAEPHLWGPAQQEWLERLESEHDNLRAALEWSLSRDEGGGMRDEGSASDRTHPSSLIPHPSEAGLRLAGALWKFWQLHGYLEEGRRWCAAALAHPAGGERTAARATALTGAGVLARVQGDYPAARALYEESLALRRELGDRRGIATSLNDLGVVSYEQGDDAAARALYEESLALRRELGDRRGIAASLNDLGLVAWNQGDYPAARALHEESLALRRELGDRRGIATSLNNLGLVSYEQSDYPAARALNEEGLSISRELGDRQGIAVSLINLGLVAYEQGDDAAARALYEESLTIYQELGDRQGIAIALEGLAPAAVALGRPARAARLWGAAERLREEIGSPPSPTGQRRFARQVAAARAALGDEAAFDRAWQEGRAMTLEQAVALALETQ